jgi:aspartate carbamoyltransferase catalytic subunit
LNGIGAKPDVVYVTRPQTERTPHHANSYKTLIFDKKCLENLSQDAIILHAGPRTEEMPDFVVKDPRCWMFEQACNGVPVRMQLLKKLV